MGSGLAAGAVLSIWAAGSLGALGVGTGRPDLASIALTTSVLIATAAIAVLPSARRAARIDPVPALRGN